MNVLANGHIKYSMWKMLITYWAQNSLAARLVQRPQTSLPPSLSLSPSTLFKSTRKPNQHQPKSRKLRVEPLVWHVPFPSHLLPRWVNKHYTILIVFPFRMRNNNNNDSEQQQEVALISVCLPLRCALIKCQRVARAWREKAQTSNGAGFAVVAATQRGSAGFHFSSVWFDQSLILVIYCGKCEQRPTKRWWAFVLNTFIPCKGI